MPPHPLRRSTRVSWRVRVRLSGMDRNQPFADDCETLVVNLHGCALQSPRPLRPGTPVQLEVAGRGLKGRIMDSVPLNGEHTRWMLGIALDQPGNHWGIQYPPEDWGAPPLPAPATAGDSLPRPTQAPGPLVGDATATDVSAEPQAPSVVLVRPEIAPPASIASPAVGAPQPIPQPPPAPSAAPPVQAPPAPASDAALQEIRAQLIQLQQAQAKQEAMLLQERTERQAARSAAEQAIAEQLERVRQAKEYVESLVCSFPSIIEAQAQEQAQAIVHKLQPQLSRADIETLVREAQQSADAALQQRIAQLAEDLRRQLEQTGDERRQAAEAACAAATSQLQALEERANHLTALVDVEMQKHAEEIIAETVAEIRKQMPQVPEAAPEPQLTAASTQQFHELEELLGQATQVADDLRFTLKAVQQEHRMNEAATACLQHRSEAVQAWLERETEKFQESVREAFVDAGGEIRGRIAQAVETAAQPIQECSRDIEQQITAVAQRHVEELHQHADVDCERLESCSEQARAAIAADMQARVTEALDSFAQDAQRVMQHSMERWQAAVTQTLAAIPKLLAENFAAER